jgi:hypothetical protein
MQRYLDDFEAARKASTSPDELIETMKRKYPDWVQEKLLVTSAKTALAAAGQHSVPGLST